MIARIALGLAMNPAPEHRWRRIALPLSVVVLVLLALSATSILAMLEREAARDAARVPVLASSPSPRDLYMIGRFDVWQGEQYSVV